MAASVLGAYDDYSYGTIFQAVNAFATLDLSAFYGHVSKDRLYTFAARSVERRSAQTAMYHMADGLTRLIAPILSFTADELWRHLPGAREESVHMAVFPTHAELDALADPELVDRWSLLITLRERVLAAFDPLGLDLATQKNEVMRALSKHFPRELMKKVYALLLRERTGR